jgi:lipid II:glycine glycyltransferase (peptidoglycan interpeptide bridge formation enzyme)
MFNSIFQEPWWLDAVAPGQWGEAMVKRGGQIIARMPYVCKKKYGFKMIITPALTQTLGPWIQNSPGKYVTQLDNQRNLLKELVEQLPEYDLYQQNWHYSVTDWLPFYWRGFQQRTRYTYIIENLSDLNKIWQGMEDKTRNIIRKAEKSGIRIDESEDIDLFIELNKKTFQRKGMKYPHSRETLRRVDAVCQERGARKIFLARDSQGKVYSALYLLYNAQTAYYLMSGAEPELRNSGANSLAVWESIKFAAATSQVYDFEGSMIEPIERFFRSFGAIQKPYFQIWKIPSPFLRLAYSLKNSKNLGSKFKRLIKS